MFFVLPVVGLLSFALILGVMAAFGLIRFYLMRDVADANIKCCGAWLHFRATLIGFAPAWWWTNRSYRGPVRRLGLSILTPGPHYDRRTLLSIAIGRREYGWRRERLGAPHMMILQGKASAALLIGGALVCALAACTADQAAKVASTAQQIQPGLQAACNDALAVANIAGLVPGVGAIVPYINAGCATAEGITKLAADPSSTEWVGQLAGKVKTLAGAAGIKLS